MIKILDYLDIAFDKKSNVYEVGIINHKVQHIHLRQGDMDGACAVYSLMMYFMLIKLLKRKDIINLDSTFDSDKRRSKGRLYKEFFEIEGLCRQGFSFDRIEEKLNHSFRKNVSVSSSMFDAKIVKDNIDNGSPVMLGISWGKEGHAVLAIGYEESEKNELTKLFCLDPGYDIGACSYWNMVIRLNDAPERKYCHTCIPCNGNYSHILLEDLLTIKVK